jgi:protein-arginine kinase activator protein McsA
LAKNAAKKAGRSLKPDGGLAGRQSPVPHGTGAQLAERLNQPRESLRDHYHIGRTLKKQLDDAVASEQYESAARLRDEIANRDRKM